MIHNNPKNKGVASTDIWSRTDFKHKIKHILQVDKKVLVNY